MKPFLTTLLLTVSVVCFSQFRAVSFRFIPAFNDRSTLTIEKLDSGFVMKIRSDAFKDTCMLSDQTVAELNAFLSQYPAKKKTLDSLERVEKEKMAKNGDYVVGLDGVTVDVVLKGDNEEQAYHFWSPSKETVDHQLIERLSPLTAYFKKPETTAYFKGLMGYFHFEKEKTGLEAPPIKVL